jgi:hypothetical protein
MDQFPSAPFLRDPITVPRSELIGQYRAQAARYQQLAERQRRSSVYEGLLALARQCAAMADALASPKGDQSAKPQLSEPEILLLLNRVIAENKSASAAPARDGPQSSSAPPALRELSLDEILQKIQRDIAEGIPLAG